MKARPKYFLSSLYQDDTPADLAEIGDYIRELHTYLWKVVRALNPGASGDLDFYVHTEDE